MTPNRAAFPERRSALPDAALVQSVLDELDAAQKKSINEILKDTIRPINQSHSENPRRRSNSSSSMTSLASGTNEMNPVTQSPRFQTVRAVFEKYSKQGFPPGKTFTEIQKTVSLLSLKQFNDFMRDYGLYPGIFSAKEEVSAMFRKLNLMSRYGESRANLTIHEFKTFIQGVLMIKMPEEHQGMSAEQALDRWRARAINTALTDLQSPDWNSNIAKEFTPLIQANQGGSSDLDSCRLRDELFLQLTRILQEQLSSGASMSRHSFKRIVISLDLHQWIFGETIDKALESLEVNDENTSLSSEQCTKLLKQLVKDSLHSTERNEIELLTEWLSIAESKQMSNLNLQKNLEWHSDERISRVESQLQHLKLKAVELNHELEYRTQLLQDIAANISQYGSFQDSELLKQSKSRLFLENVLSPEVQVKKYKSIIGTDHKRVQVIGEAVIAKLGEVIRKLRIFEIQDWVNNRKIEQAQLAITARTALEKRLASTEQELSAAKSSAAGALQETAKLKKKVLIGRKAVLMNRLMERKLQELSVQLQEADQQKLDLMRRVEAAESNLQTAVERARIAHQNEQSARLAAEKSKGETDSLKEELDNAKEDVDALKSRIEDATCVLQGR